MTETKERTLERIDLAAIDATIKSVKRTKDPRAKYALAVEVMSELLEANAELQYRLTILEAETVRLIDG